MQYKTEKYSKQPFETFMLAPNKLSISISRSYWYTRTHKKILPWHIRSLGNPGKWKQWSTWFPIAWIPNSFKISYHTHVLWYNSVPIQHSRSRIYLSMGEIHHPDTHGLFIEAQTVSSWSIQHNVFYSIKLLRQRYHSCWPFHSLQ